MYGVRHSVEAEFPEFYTEITRLKHCNADFSRLLAVYDETDKKIYGLEQLNQPVTDDYFAYLKRQRVLLKDQLYAMLKRNLATF